MSFRFIFAAAVVLGSTAASAGVTVTAEAPGVQNSTASFTSVGIENFDARSTGAGQNFATNFGGSIYNGQYTDVQIDAANVYGGAGGNTNHAVTFTGTGYTLDLTTSDPAGVNYFGFWLSALDGQNQLEFYKGGSLVFTFSAATALAFINSQPNAAAYFGNPNAPFLGGNNGEPYAFINFYGRSGTTFDQIKFFQDPVSGGYESDNHTVGKWSRLTGDPLGTVPEPSSWAMLIAGFGLVGAASRRRRQVVAA